MNTGRTVFAQLMDFLPLPVFRACVARYRGDHHVQSFSCLDQFLTLTFAQLTRRESLREIETCLRAMQPKLYHMGFRCGTIARTTLAHANEVRDWRIYADFAHHLIATARPLYATDPLGVELTNTVYALDATTIDLCLSLFPWATFRRTKGAIKLHTLLDLRGSIPTVVHVTHGTTADCTMLDALLPEPGAFYLLDRGYFDMPRLWTLAQAAAFFVVRGKRKIRLARLSARPVDRTTGLRSDCIMRFTGPTSRHDYPERIRRVRYVEAIHARSLTFFTNNFTLPALSIASLYRLRWQVELFFKWIKQHLRIKAFYGTSANAVHTQLWIAITTYVLVAIVRKRLNIPLPLYTLLQILDVCLFEKVDMVQRLTAFQPGVEELLIGNQLSFLDL